MASFRFWNLFWTLILLVTWRRILTVGNTQTKLWRFLLKILFRQANSTPESLLEISERSAQVHLVTINRSKHRVEKHPFSFAVSRPTVSKSYVVRYRLADRGIPFDWINSQWKAAVTNDTQQLQLVVKCMSVSKFPTITFWDANCFESCPNTPQLISAKKCDVLWAQFWLTMVTNNARASSLRSITSRIYTVPLSD